MSKRNPLHVTGDPENEMTLKREFFTENTRQEFFNTGGGFYLGMLDRYVPDKLSEPDVRGVMVIRDVYNEEFDHYTSVSKYFTADMIDNIDSVEDYMDDQIFSMEMYEGYADTGGCHIRVIYNR